MEINHEQARFSTVGEFPKHEPAFTVGGVRHILFHKGDDLEKAGVVCRFGRKILIDVPAFRNWIAAGGARNIAGGK